MTNINFKVLADVIVVRSEKFTPDNWRRHSQILFIARRRVTIRTKRARSRSEIY